MRVSHPASSIRHRSTPVARSEKIEKLTPCPSHVAPSGYGLPGFSLTAVPLLGCVMQSWRPCLPTRLRRSLQNEPPNGAGPVLEPPTPNGSLPTPGLPPAPNALPPVSKLEAPPSATVVLPPVFRLPVACPPATPMAPAS